MFEEKRPHKIVFKINSNKRTLKRAIENEYFLQNVVIYNECI